MIALTGLSSAMFSVSLVMLCLSLKTVGLRCFVRIKMIRAIGWDDGLMLLAMALFTVVCVVSMVGSFYGIGRTSTGMPPENVETALLCFFLSEVFYILTCTAGRVSICIALLRITIEKIHKVILYLLIAVTTVAGLVTWLVILLQCHPVSQFWHPENNGRCKDIEIIIAIGYTYTGFAIVCDFTIGLLPIAIIWKLQRSCRTRFGLAFTLGLGWIACCALVVRLPFLPRFRNSDTLGGTTQIMLLSIIEDGLGIIAGSLVTLRPLFRSLLPGGTRGTCANTILQHIPFSKSARNPDVQPPWSHIEINSNNSATAVLEGGLRHGDSMSESTSQRTEVEPWK
ncbi:hypothetical protein ASPVEDRAFT_202760 [Aspergillus versicolor CBS 583.65]|uniref:Rhodopsin domain-containing protein n=1 Tax=Aspergillus versicolor CBS 583.65 TaxID=1036611 RepID=A0A1L9Q1U1_ASPVE|nr:uncharacterized protein ASPVEDRAFT_202760 [Aspergillus versicolor CBS 583.65]OJJ07744.1 hypothetical protein ASPVEDRAFT_202760 [Aspergillus versicolor CBS 583.65]